MEITSVDVIPVSVPYTTSLDIAGGGSPTAYYLVVRVQTDEGVEGICEAKTTPSFAGAGRETALAAIESHLGPAVVGVDPRNLVADHDAMDRALSGSPFAKAASTSPATTLRGRPSVFRCRHCSAAGVATRSPSASRSASSRWTTRWPTPSEPSTGTASPRSR